MPNNKPQLFHEGMEKKKWAYPSCLSQRACLYNLQNYFIEKLAATAKNLSNTANTIVIPPLCFP